MSLNNIPNTLPSIERLVQRVSVADKAQQKDIRLSIQEARDLIAELAMLTSKLGKTITDIQKSLEEIKATSNSSSGPVSFDGGSF